MGEGIAVPQKATLGAARLPNSPEQVGFTARTRAIALGARQVLRLLAGRTLAVVGESGCGKSTLARQVTMIETPTAGELWLDGIDMTRADAAQRKTVRPLVQRVFQNPLLLWSACSQR